MNAKPGVALALSVLAGCAAVGPDYAGPGASAADELQAFPSAGPDRSARPPRQAWWETLRDPVLAALIERALVANEDLALAVANVEAARAVLGETSTQRRPRVDVAADLRERREPEAAGAKGDPHAAQPTLAATSAALGLAWEIDLFGRVRRSIEAAQGELDSLEAVRDDVRVVVVAEVARAYIDLRGAQARRGVAERNVGVQRDTLDLVLVLSREGAATELDVARARTQLLTSQATIPSFNADVSAASNRLATLTAHGLDEVKRELEPHAPLPALPRDLDLIAPAELLRRRPDIVAAERALAAATARIGVATADLFPTVTLLGTAGISAAPLSEVTASGAPLFSLGPALTWNIFDREAIYARIAQADSAAAGALARYRASVRTALEEADSALAAYQHETARHVELAAAVAASRIASELARLRYREGVEDFLAVLDAERNVLQLEDQLALSQIALAQYLVDIERAFGGGWLAQASGTVTVKR